MNEGLRRQVMPALAALILLLAACGANKAVTRYRVALGIRDSGEAAFTACVAAHEKALMSDADYGKARTAYTAFRTGMMSWSAGEQLTGGDAAGGQRAALDALKELLDLAAPYLQGRGGES